MEASSAPRSAGGSDDGDTNNSSEFLTRQEVIERRSRRLKRLAKVYRDHYWSLMEDLRLKHREYYWKYGKSPFKEEDDNGEGEARGNGLVTESVNNNKHSTNRGNCGGDLSSGGKLGLGLGLEFGESFCQCRYPGCTLKAMALTTYCHSHILWDTKQKLYKGCKYISRKSLNPCGKPILTSTNPSLCPTHLPKADRNFKQALKKGGVSVASTTKLGSKFHVVIAKYVHLIQTRRRRASRNRDNLAIKVNVSRKGTQNYA